jgi:hypothetical protein
MRSRTHNKSGGRLPAVGIGIAIYNGTCTNSRQTAEGACAGRRCVRVQVNHGGLTPPALALRCERLPAKNDFCDAQTYIRSGAAGVSPPWSGEPGAGRSKSRSVRRRPTTRPRAAGVSPPWVGKRASPETGAIRRQTIEGVCADRRCIRVYGRHGANVAPESFMAHTAPDYNRVHWRHGGLTPPALVLVCGRPPAKQRFLRCTNAHSTKSGGRQPAVVR